MQTVQAYVEGLEGLDTKQKKHIIGNLKIAEVKVTAKMSPGVVSIIKKMADRMRKQGNVTRAVTEPKVGEYDKAILAGIDPQTGDKIPEVLLAKGRRALYNPETRVVYPIPDLNNTKTTMDEV
jgi:hypothetical protein